jgi:hypothetical protein
MFWCSMHISRTPLRIFLKKSLVYFLAFILKFGFQWPSLKNKPVYAYKSRKNMKPTIWPSFIALNMQNWSGGIYIPALSSHLTTNHPFSPSWAQIKGKYFFVATQKTIIATLLKMGRCTILPNMGPRFEFFLLKAPNPSSFPLKLKQPCLR